jgi:hypothetical protein
VGSFVSFEFLITWLLTASFLTASCIRHPRSRYNIPESRNPLRRPSHRTSIGRADAAGFSLVPGRTDAAGFLLVSEIVLAMN